MASLGSLVVSLAMDTASFTAAADKTRKKMLDMQASAVSVGKAIGANLGLAIGTMALMVRQAINTADEMQKMSASIGITAQTLGELTYAAELSGVAQEELAVAMGKFARNATEAKAGTEQQVAVFKTLGIAVTNAGGEVKPLQQLLGEVADKFAASRNSAEKTTIAMELFGKSGAKLIPLLNAGSAGINELMQEARDLGMVFDDETGKAAEQFNDNLTRLKTAATGLATSMMKELMPSLTGITDEMVKAAKEGGFLKTVFEKAAEGMKYLIVGAAQGVYIFMQVADTIGAVLAALVALDRGDFQAARNIYKDWKEQGEKARLEIDAFTDSVLRSNESITKLLTGKRMDAYSDPRSLMFGKEKPTLDTSGLNKKTKEVKDKLTEEEKALQALAKKWNETVASLGMDVQAFGSSESTRQILEVTQAIREGLDPAVGQRAIDLIHQLEDLKEAAKKAADAEKARQDGLAEAAAIHEAVRTPMQQLSDGLARLVELQQRFGLSAEDAARQEMLLWEAYDNATKAADKKADEMTKFVERARQNIQDNLGDTLVDMMNGNFKSIGDGFVKMIQRMVAEALAAKLTEALFGGVGKEGGAGQGQGLFGQALSWLGSSLFGGKAIGGPVSPHRAYMVGEHGPEMFVPTTAGKVEQPRGAMTFVINVQAQAGMSRQTAMQQGTQIGLGIQRAMARNT